MKKRIISAVTAFCLFIGMAIPTFAANTGATEEPATPNVTVATVTGGKIEVGVTTSEGVTITYGESVTATTGQSVSVKITPDQDYKLVANSVKATPAVTTDSAVDVAVTMTDNIGTFEMPAYPVQVTAEFRAVENKPAITSLTISETTKEITIGDTNATLTVKVEPANAETSGILWESSNSNFATVTPAEDKKSATIKPLAEGNTTITVQAGDITTSCAVTVKAKEQVPVKVSKITIPGTLSLLFTKDATLSVNVEPADADNKAVTWSVKSSTPADVVTVDANTGKVTANSTTGSAVVIATATDGSNIVSNDCVVTVSNEEVKATSVEITPNTLTLEEGKTGKVAAIIYPPNANSNNTVTFESNNPNAAIVDADGNVTAVAEGEATIVAKLEGNIVSTNSCEVTVTPKASTDVPAETVILAPATVTLNANETQVVGVSYVPTNATIGKEITWTVEDTNSAIEFNQDTLTITAKEVSTESTATITATLKNGKTATCVVTVNAKTSTDIPATGVTITPEELKLNLEDNKTGKVTATLTPEGANINNTVTFESSDTAVATVDADGNVTAMATGTATITAILEGSIVSTNSCAVTVEEKSNPATGVTITPETMTLEEGATGNVTAKVTPEGANSNNTVKFLSSNSAVATVDETTGEVTAIAEGTATITATLPDETVSTNSCVVTVTPKASTDVPATGVTIDPSELNLEVGASGKVTATVTPEGANSNNTVKFESSNPNVATVDADGNVTAIAAGTANITAKLPDGQTATCVVTVKDVVTPPTPKPELYTVSKNIVGPAGADLAVSPAEALTDGVEAGAVVNVKPVFPAEGAYTLEVTSSDVAIEKSGDVYIFTMPAADVKVNATFKKVVNPDVKPVEPEVELPLEVESVDPAPVEKTEDNKVIATTKTFDYGVFEKVQINFEAPETLAEKLSNAILAVEPLASDEVNEVLNTLNDIIKSMINNSDSNVAPSIQAAFELELQDSVTGEKVNLETNTQEMTIVIQNVTPSVPEGHEAALFHIHNGVANRVYGARFVGNDVIFTTNKFSTFVVASVPVERKSNKVSYSGSASFSNYYINATAGAGGTISPEGWTTVTAGNNFTYEVSPEAGYTVDKVVVDGNKEVTLVNGKYTFENVSEPYSIHVTFKKTGSTTTPITPNVPSTPSVKPTPNAQTGDSLPIAAGLLLAGAASVLVLTRKKLGK